MDKQAYLDGYMGKVSDTVTRRQAWEAAIDPSLGFRSGKVPYTYTSPEKEQRVDNIIEQGRAVRDKHPDVFKGWYGEASPDEEIPIRRKDWKNRPWIWNRLAGWRRGAFRSGAGGTDRGITHSERKISPQLLLHESGHATNPHFTPEGVVSDIERRKEDPDGAMQKLLDNRRGRDIDNAKVKTILNQFIKPTYGGRWDYYEAGPMLMEVKALLEREGVDTTDKGKVDEYLKGVDVDEAPDHLRSIIKGIREYPEDFRHLLNILIRGTAKVDLNKQRMEG